MDAFGGLRLAVLLVAAGAFATGSSPAALAQTWNVPADQSAAIAYARTRVSAGALDDAIFSLERYLEVDSQADDAARYLGDLQYRHGDVSAAERTYRRLLTFAPKDPVTHDHLGRLYAAHGRIADALREFEQTLPSSSGYRHLVELHRLRGDLDEFVVRYRHDADAHPLDAAMQFAYGAIERSAHRPADATPYLNRAVRLQQTCEAFSELGNTEYDLAHYAAAISAFKQCLALEPGDYSATLDLGNVYVITGEAETARRLFEKALALMPDRPEALVDMGYLDDIKRDSKSAVPLYLKALAIDPLIPEAYVDLGYDYDVNGLYERAVATYRSGLIVAPDSGRLHFLLGDTYLHEGKPQLARPEYERAATSDEGDVARAAARELQSLGEGGFT